MNNLRMKMMMLKLKNNIKKINNLSPWVNNNFNNSKDF